MPEHLTWAWSAFNDLSTCRPLGALGGAGAIPWVALDAYAHRYGIESVDEFDRFVALIRAMDRAYLEHQDETKPRETPKKAGKR